MRIKTKSPRGYDYLTLALYAFATLGIEVLYAYFLEPLIYGGSLPEWSTPQIILHWTITCMTWIACGYFILKYANKKYGFKLTQQSPSIKTWQWLLTAFFILLSLFSSYNSWSGSKILLEFQRNGMPRFLFQYIYYLVETFLFMLIIIFGQLAFETWFQHPNIPYGGIAVALTWGLAHAFTKGSLSSGIYSAIGGFGFGVVYLLLNRKIKWTYLALCIMFIC